MAPQEPLPAQARAAPRARPRGLRGRREAQRRGRRASARFVN